VFRGRKLGRVIRRLRSGPGGLLVLTLVVALVVAAAVGAAAGAAAAPAMRDAAGAAAGTAVAAGTTTDAAGTDATQGGVGALVNDWPTFDYNTQRSGVGPADTGITAANLHELKRLTVHIPGVIDSAMIELSDVTIGGRGYDLLIGTTAYGDTLALNAANGHTLWRFFPAADRALQGSAQITTAAPVADPGGEYVYVTTPDGFVHKLSVTDGRQLWSTRMTYLPTHEKLAGSLNIADGELIVVTDGYDGDAPPYQGHVVTLDMASGRVTHVFNTLCSHVTTIIRHPGSCPASDSAIWGRPGSVIEPNGNILVTTGNGPFNGHTDWGDSVLELSPTLRLLHNWTPTNQEQLNQDDWDLGSTEPALLPVVSGAPLAVQGGKEGYLRLLDLNKLDGTTAPAGPRTGGELQSVSGPGPTDIFSQPAVWTSGSGQIYMFVADGDGTAAYTLTHRRLRLAWEDGTAGTSPVVAGGLLYVYDLSQGQLDVRNPRTGRLYVTLPASPGHWNSPIVIGGRVVLPEGDDNDHLTTGTIDIYHLPGV
jgi:outer membrane protein assembly factor BamB